MTRMVSFTILALLADLASPCADVLFLTAPDKASAYVLFNNRAEGNAPLTVEALVDQMRI